MMWLPSGKSKQGIYFNNATASQAIALSLIVTIIGIWCKTKK